jgi:hypothetical protein
MAKTMSLRLDDQQAATLELIARAEDRTVTDAVRDAISAHIDERRNDTEFQERLARYLDEEREVLERLGR